MITKENILQTIVQKYPDFEHYYNRFIEEFWGQDEVGGCTLLSEFEYFCIPIITSATIEEKKKLFLFIEHLAVNGDDDISTAVYTCFVENLINIAGDPNNNSNLKYSHFVPYLGPESREYVRAWDKFTGVKTPGIDD